MGFVTDDGYLHCSRPERGGALEPSDADPPTYAHIDREDCRCGAPHVALSHGSQRNGQRPASRNEKVVQLPAARRPRRLGVRGWDICNRQGTLVARHLRYELDAPPWKDFVWVQPNGDLGLGDDVRCADLMYGLETLGDAQTVIVVEGEKTADALRSLGCGPVLGTVQGAHSQPSRQVLMELRGCRVFLWRDADEVGHGHMTRIAEGLRDIAGEIRWIEWGTQPKDDAADFVERGGTLEDLKRMLAESTLLNAPEVVTVRRVGLGYEGESRGRWTLKLGRLHRTNQDVKGILRVSDLGRTIAAGSFNIASLTTRTTTAKYLAAQTDGYKGWSTILEEFCQQVIALEQTVSPPLALSGQLMNKAEEWLLAPVLPLNAVTWLYAPPGSTKSYFAGLFALTAITGAEVCGWTPRVGPVLILDWESNHADWSDRLTRLANGLATTTGRPVVPDWGLVRHQRMPRPLHEMQEEVAEWVIEQDVRLVIIDSFGMAAGAGSERAPVEFTTTRLFECLRPLNTTCIVIDHVSKQDKRTRGNQPLDPIGSQYKLALARMGYELRAEDHPMQGQTEVVVTRAKVNRGRRQVLGTYRFAGFDSDTVTVERMGKPSAPELVAVASSIPDRMAELLGEQGAMDIGAIAKELGCTNDTVRKNADRYPHRFQRLRRGFYGLAAG